MDADVPAARPGNAPARVGGDRARAAELAVAGIRSIMMLAVLTAVIATFRSSAANAPVNPFNFFGFFTIQANLLGVAVFGLVAVLGFAGRPQSLPVQLVRGSVTSYLLVVGLVYNTLLTGVAGGVELGWANSIMHVIFPVYCLLDWVLVPDRSALPFRYLWVVEVYPVLWLAVVLVRGATDGWVPYPFLNPAAGYATVVLYVAGIAVTFIAVGAAVFWASRLRLIRAGS